MMKLSSFANDWMADKNTERNHSLVRVISYMGILLDTQLLTDAPKAANILGIYSHLYLYRRLWPFFWHVCPTAVSQSSYITL